LHEELGYDVIAFESSFAECERAQQRAATMTPVELMRGCATGVWHTAEVLPLFEYIKATQGTARPLMLAGFDIQFRRPESQSTFDTDTPAFARQLELSYGAFRRIWADRQRMGAIRDSAMAENLEFILTEHHPGRKILVWAHNAHIRHSRGAHTDTTPQSPRQMGSWVARRRRAELYTIGLYMYRGSAAANDRVPYPIRQSRPNSLESILHQAPWRYAFVDFSMAKRERGSEWIWSAIDALELGRFSDRVVPRNAYDAVLFIETVQPPEYR
jgi:erythromycin esterase-like protein